MASPLLTSQRLLFVLAVLLLINSQLPPAWAGLAARPVKPVVDLLLLPMQAPVHGLALSLADAGDDPQTQDPESPEAVAARYHEARVENERLRQRVVELERRLYLVENVRELVESQTRPLSAAVVGYSDTGALPVLTLNRGRRHGVEPDMSVVYLSSIVGRVLAPVGPGSCQVELVTAHRAGLQVRVQPRGSDLRYDNIRVTLGQDERTFVAQVARDSEIGEGADVLLADGVHYPDARGRLLGVVERVTEYPPDPLLQKQLVIRPAHDLRYLKEVAVLVPIGRTDPAAGSGTR